MDANVSSRIDLMRIVLVSGIVFVHIPFDPQTSPFLGAYGFLDRVRVYLGESLFRVGVPCLNAISGYLLFRRGIDSFDYRRMLTTKARTIPLPFLIWSGAFFVAVLVAQPNGIGFGYLPDVVHAAPRDYPLFSFTMPILVIAILVASHNLMGRLAPDLLGALTGSRAGAGRMAPPAHVGGHASYSPQQR
ncbi:acyltransferase [Ensifer sp. IC3342]|nr:acyltransferase [Ensifer sp. BRP08]MCA1449501.1 acyltransferase [Ensifer sp. IC3342]